MTQKKPVKKVILALAIVGAVVFAGAYGYAVAPTETRKIEPGPLLAAVASGSTPDAGLIEKGRYVATASDCIACHTAPGGKEFAGGRVIQSPIGNMYSTNITPDKATGIGNYTLDDFDRAIRHGITPSGGTLYPAMPFPSYAKMSDDDLRALYAYFMHSVKPAAQENRAADITWPLSMRWPLGIWRKTFVPVQGPMDMTRYADGRIARGAYLVQSLGHCGTCHTPRAATLNELALDDSGPEFLAGGPLIDGWLAVNLRGDKVDGMGNWSEKDIVDTLKTGRNAHSGVLGEPMQDVVAHSTQNMTDDDLSAMAAYIKTLPETGGKKSSFAASEATVQKIMSGNDGERGVQLYLDNCAACHRVDGKASGKVFPALPGNPTVLQEDATSLIRVVLAGARLPSTKTAPSDLGMPGFAWRLSDEETAQLTTFVRNAWGNKASAVEAGDVAEVRKALKDHEIHTVDKRDSKH